MHEEILTKAETAHQELLTAYGVHNEERARFQRLLGMEATGSEAVGLLRKYGPMVLKYGSTAGGGAGVLAILGNAFPQLSAVLGLGG
ncbi:MAG: hypothetical protein V3S55_15205 [Nitrospiraceae bacterium]